MRAWRRGTKEMDLILGGYADTRLAGLTGGALDTFEALLDESDQDLYRWVSGQETPPPRYGDLVQELATMPGRG